MGIERFRQKRSCRNRAAALSAYRENSGLLLKGGSLVLSRVLLRINQALFGDIG